MIGLIVIMIIIIVGGIYFWTSRPAAAPDTGSTTGESTNTEIEKIQSQESSDETTTIDSDLNAYGEAEIENIGNDL